MSYIGLQEFIKYTSKAWGKTHNTSLTFWSKKTGELSQNLNNVFWLIHLYR